MGATAHSLDLWIKEGCDEKATVAFLGAKSQRTLNSGFDFAVSSGVCGSGLHDTFLQTLQGTNLSPMMQLETNRNHC
jgi:hypothetical protein